MLSCSTLVVFVGSLVGNNIAPTENLSTLPVALSIIGTASSTIPVAFLMQKFGRKVIFQFTPIAGIGFAALSALSIENQSFVLFCVSTYLLGTTLAIVQQFRFAAIESVPPDVAPKAASQVLLGGIASAFLGPEVAYWGKNIFTQPYSGSVALIAVLYSLGFLLLNYYQNTESISSKSNSNTRPIIKIATQTVFIVAALGAVVGYSIMSFIMTATPISMHVMDGHSLENTKWVIQSHIMAMFIPSLLTAWIIKKIGIGGMMSIGLFAYAICIGLAYSGHGFMHYWWALVLLGIGWNFLFIGGTTLLPQSYHPSERFKVQALNEFLVFGTQAIAAISAGWILFMLQWENLLLLTIPLILVQSSALLLWKLQSRNVHSK